MTGRRVKLISLVQGSEVFLGFPIEEENGEDLTDDITAAISLDGGATWLAAEWIGDVGPERTVRTQQKFDTTTVEKASYVAWVKLDDDETNIIVAGTVQVV